MMLAYSEWHGVADGIRDINGRGAGADSRFNDASQIVDRRTACVFTGEFHVVGIVTRTFHHINSAFDDFIQRAAQLGGDMHRRRGDEGVDAERFRHF